MILSVRNFYLVSSKSIIAFVIFTSAKKSKITFGLFTGLDFDVATYTNVKWVIFNVDLEATTIRCFAFYEMNKNERKHIGKANMCEMGV